MTSSPPTDSICKSNLVTRLKIMHFTEGKQHQSSLWQLNKNMQRPKESVVLLLLLLLLFFTPPH